ncbi:MAG: DUF480 domain-containing protein [Desulfobacteraceae bacterium]|nr:MAG: DUF480 domain-containing protein [Desulfobacteraceae bacterium]
MELILDDQEARVIGSLIEKQLSTPEYYPLSLNALTNACNQKSNREPVVAYDETTVESVLEGLIRKKLVNKSLVGRVPKYEELFIRDHNLVPKEAAILCVLLLRGPQTPGELRSRSTRLFDFASLEALMETLNNLQTWGMVQCLPRRPGQKEPRYRHLFGEPAEPGETELVQGDAAEPGRIDTIEREIAWLKAEMASLKAVFESFRKQFE